jgi:hypothetical protein
VRASSHRFLLALLLNVPSCPEILKLVRKRYPAEDPLDLVLRWCKELSETPDPTSPQQNALGIALDESGLDVMAAMLKTSDSDNALALLTLLYGEAQVRAERATLFALMRAFKSSLVFSRLFSNFRVVELTPEYLQSHESTFAG